VIDEFVSTVGLLEVAVHDVPAVVLFGDEFERSKRDRFIRTVVPLVPPIMWCRPTLFVSVTRATAPVPVPNPTATLAAPILFNYRRRVNLPLLSFFDAVEPGVTKHVSKPVFVIRSTVLR